jgi:hypothetical protein
MQRSDVYQEKSPVSSYFHLSEAKVCYKVLAKNIDIAKRINFTTPYHPLPNLLPHDLRRRPQMTVATGGLMPIVFG